MCHDHCDSLEEVLAYIEQQNFIEDYEGLPEDLTIYYGVEVDKEELEKLCYKESEPKTKTVFGWVVDANKWNNTLPPKVQVDYYFSSREAFEKVVGKSVADKNFLFPVQVPESFDDLDYCSDNY